MNVKKDDQTLTVGSRKCNYPNCQNCINDFAIPMCMLEDARVETEKAIIIEPRDGYVIIRNDEEDETLKGE